MSLPLLLALIGAVGTVLAFVGMNILLSNQIDLESRLGPYAGGHRSWGPGEVTALPGRRSGRIGVGRSFSAALAQDLARANLKLTVSEYLMLHLLCALILFIIGYLVSGNVGAAAVAGAFGLYLPRLYVKQRQARRLAAFNSQLGDTLMLAANSLRAGHSLLQSLEVIAREASQPTSEEFRRVVREVSLGLPPEQALANLVRRIQSEDLDMMVTAINVQHEVGGNLSEILDTISGTIRERVRVKGEIRALTSQQRLSGYIISLLPVALAGILYLLNPEYISRLFTMEQIICMPAIGLPIIAGLMIFAGFMVIQKIVAIDV